MGNVKCHLQPSLMELSVRKMMNSQPQGLLKMLNSSEHINTSWAELAARLCQEICKRKIEMGDGRKLLHWILSPSPARARIFFRVCFLAVVYNLWLKGTDLKLIMCCWVLKCCFSFVELLLSCWAGPARRLFLFVPQIYSAVFCNWSGGKVHFKICQKS